MNENGQLECAFGRERDVDRNDSDGGPSGPYERSCTNIRMEGYTLKATCQRNDGSWRWSELEYAYDCDGRIRNSNGRLVCRGGYLNLSARLAQKRWMRLQASSSALFEVA